MKFPIWATNVDPKSEKSRNLDQGENGTLWERLDGQIAC